MKNQDIKEYIDKCLADLEREKILSRADKSCFREYKEIEEAKNIFSTEDTKVYELSYEDKVKMIDERISLIKQQRKAIAEYGNDYAKPYELLKIDSEITGKKELISTCNVSRSAIHLHCGVSRAPILDENGNNIQKIGADGKAKIVTYFTKILEEMRKYYYSENENTTLEEKKTILDRNYSEHIEPLIYETMKRCTEILEKYPHLQSINLDTNPSFMRFVSSALTEYGFADLTNTDEHQKALREQFPDENIPEDRLTAATISREKIMEYVKNREDKQKFNYNTHTSLCGHADGEIDEFVQKAIASGMKQLGFSDHTPNALGHIDKKHEMSIEQFEKIYIPELQKIKEKYAKKIGIKIGLESEYYGDEGEKHPVVKSFREKTDSKLDYIILGQHTALKRDKQGNLKMPPESADLKSADYPIDYALTVVEAIKSGKFAYVAHPDIFMEKRDFISEQDRAIYDENVKKATEMICETASKYDIPLEVNLGSISAIEAGEKERLKDGSYAYPVPDFWKVAQEKGCNVLIGIDAHSPNALKEKKNEEIAKNLLESKGINLNYLDSFEPKGIGRECKGYERFQEQKDGINILRSGIEATENSTRISEIKYQERTINEVHRDRKMSEQSHEKTRN